MSGIEILGIAHVCILACNLDQTADWYNRVLGIPKQFNFINEDREVVGFYLSIGKRTHLEVFHADHARPKDSHVLNHICFEVENIDAAIQHIRAQNVVASDKLYGCDDTWQSWVTDPNGLKIELFEYTKKSAQFVGGDRIV